MTVKKGTTRIVFVFRRFVIKIPNFLVQHDHFLIGCCANWSERKTCRQLKNWNGMSIKHKLAPTVFCSWFGLLQIQMAATIFPNNTFLTEEQEDYFKDVTSDIKPSNFGIYNGREVCVDYGQKP